MARPPSHAGVIVLTRSAPDLEVYWVERSAEAAFLPGHRAFVGGRVERSDHGIPLDGDFADEVERAVAVAAVREVYEEVGVLVARFATPVTEDRLRQSRQALLEGRPFAPILEDLGARLDASLLVPAGRWITPEFAPRRFDTRFFLADLPPGQEPVIHTGELARGDWTAPAAALARWQRAEALVPPPVLCILRSLAAGRAPERRPAPVSGTPGGERIEFFPGVVLVPLETHTLPPASHTNAYVVGRADAVLIDPGSNDPSELELLLGLVDELRQEGVRPRALLLTHHHRDHVAGAKEVARRLELPVWAHPLTASRLEDCLEVDRRLEDGERIELGAGQALTVLHTPGHAPGHLCFLEERTGALLSGDNAVGLGTVLIDPPEGDMDAYLASLERMAAQEARAIFGGHGPPLPQPARRLRALIDHRRWRQRQVLAAVEAGLSSLEAIAERAYPELGAPRPLAERQTLAHLESLERAGGVRSLQGRYEPV